MAEEAEEEFKDINEEVNESGTESPAGPIRVRLPRGEQKLGIIEQRHGGNKMMVACLDGKSRNCRVPGRLKRALWLRPGDVVMIEPWEFDKDKGDVIFKYTPTQISWLKKNGYLKTDKMEF